MVKKILKTYTITPLGLGALILILCSAAWVGVAFPQSRWQKMDVGLGSSSVVNSITASGSLALGSVSGDPTAKEVRSIDSGKTWVTALVLPPIKLKSVSRFFVYGVRGDSIMTSTTEGLTWSVKRPSLQMPIGDVHFTDPDQAWAVGDSPFVAVTSNNWGSFQNYRFPVDSVSMSGVQFLDKDFGFAAGRKTGSFATIILRTTDGGISWQERNLPDVCNTTQLLVMDFVTPSIGWAVQTCGVNTSIYKTTDSGLIWRSQATLGFFRAFAIDAVDSLHAWVVGALGVSGAIFATSDGGNWFAQTIPLSGQLFSVAMLDTSQGFASGNNATLLVYSPLPSSDITISASPESFAFTADQGGGNPADQSLTITASDQSLFWSISKASNQPWLGVTPTNGTGNGQVSVSGNIAGLNEGNYFDTLIVSAPQAMNSPLRIPVHLQVGPMLTPASLEASPLSLSFVGRCNQVLPPLTLTITNRGQLALNWAATILHNASWLSICPTSGTNSGLITVTVTTNLDSSSYEDTIKIEATGALNSPQLVPVSLLVHCPPTLKGDLNCDGELSPADVVIELNAVFLGVPPPC